MLILHMKQILPKSAQHSAEFPIVCMIIYGWIQSTAESKRQDVRWCSFRWSIPLSIDYVWESSMESVISIPSCSYSIWNRYCQNHCRILPDFLLFVWFHAVEFNRLPCSNDNVYENVVFADRFRYPLTMFRNRALIGVSRLLHDHIAYEIHTSKIIAAFCRISYCLYDIMRLNSIACRVQMTRCTMM